MRRFRLFIHTLTHLVNDNYGGFLAPLLPLLAVQHDLSLAAAGLLVSVQTLAASLFQPLWAYFSDRFPSRWFILLGVLSTAIFFSLIGVMPNVPALMLTIFLGGVGIACFHPLATAVAAALTTRKKGIAIAIFITGGTAGYAVGPVFIAAIVEAYGLHGTPIAIIPGILIVIAWYFLGPRKVRRPKNDASDSDQQIAVKNIPRAALALLTGISFIRAVVLLAYGNFISFHLQETGMELQQRSYYIFALHVGGAIGGLFYGSLSDRLGRWRVIFWTPLLALPLFYWFNAAEGTLAIIILFLAGSVTFASAPAVVVAAQKMMPGREGMASALQIGLAWGSAGLTMGLVGKLGEIFGVGEVLFGISALPLLMSILALFVAKYRHQFEG
ncbi:MFS transporter [bacterium]|nr:MFS transporter [bacterium]